MTNEEIVKLTNLRGKELLRAVLAFIESQLPKPGLLITIKDPKTGDKMTIIRKLQEPKIDYSEDIEELTHRCYS